MNPKLSHPHIGPTRSAVFFDEQELRRIDREDGLYLLGLAVVFFVIVLRVLW